MGASWAFLLVSWNFSFQNCSSPFSPWQMSPFLSTGVPINLSQVQLLFLAMRQFDWPIAKKSWNNGGSQNRKFYGKMECLPLWPTYIGEKGRTLGKTYEIKARCYWEHPWGTHWEPREHIEALPQHRSLNKLPSPKKEAWFGIFNWGAIGNILQNTLGIDQKSKIPLSPAPAPCPQKREPKKKN